MVLSCLRWVSCKQMTSGLMPKRIFLLIKELLSVHPLMFHDANVKLVGLGALSFAWLVSLELPCHPLRRSRDARCCCDARIAAWLSSLDSQALTVSYHLLRGACAMAQSLNLARRSRIFVCTRTTVWAVREGGSPTYHIPPTSYPITYRLLFIK